MTDTREILRNAKTIAVVGLSPNRTRPSYGVSEYMKRAGYRIIPVNPGHPKILGEKSYRRLEDVPEPVDIVNVFRRPEHVPPHVDDIIATNPRAVWLQLGIRNDEAAERLARAGIDVIQDRCLKVELMRMGL